MDDRQQLQQYKPPSLLAKMAEKYSVDPDKMLVTLKATAFKGDVSNEQMMALLIVADQYGLNPWTKEIYAFPDQRNGIVPVVGVDGWSRIINEHPQFDGLEFAQDEESCTCIIYRKDRGHPTSVTEYMSECRRDIGPWKSHPKRMLRHKALIQAARLAFGYTGIYDQDEAERIIAPDGPKNLKLAAVLPEPEDSAERTELILQLEDAASHGWPALQTAWMELNEENRKLVGVDFGRIKKSATTQVELAS